ncbi:hypothetical protein CEXT_318501 [Caerostris extrusa]|uniref:Uncharacterized protein n=1 Tax=Caerostris extrusa TaxID=172846 RepID=A0AAV4RA84_CAEEX|nr:hypothetical protein CEXT_318501 [Caerostris extrusa]
MIRTSGEDERGWGWKGLYSRGWASESSEWKRLELAFSCAGGQRDFGGYFSRVFSQKIVPTPLHHVVQLFKTNQPSTTISSTLPCGLLTSNLKFFELWDEKSPPCKNL